MGSSQSAAPAGSLDRTVPQRTVLGGLSAAVPMGGVCFAVATECSAVPV